MPLINQESRISHHTIYGDGATGCSFSIPPSEDFTDGTWDSTGIELMKSEIGVNEVDKKAYIRIDDEIKEFQFTTVIGATGPTGADGLGIVNKTYAELKAMYDGSTLIPGQYYKITDFATVHNVLDGNTTSGDINTGINEPLILLATSINTFDKQAYSIAYPKDVIYYDIDNTNFDNDLSFYGICVANYTVNGTVTEEPLSALHRYLIGTGATGILTGYDNYILGINSIGHQHEVHSIKITDPELAKDGLFYYVPSAATGVWSTHLNELAQWVNNDWSYVVCDKTPPFTTGNVYDNSTGFVYDWTLSGLTRIDPWNFIEPTLNMTIFNEFDSTYLQFNGTYWVSYEPTFLKGVIYYRKDTIQNVECWYDFRNVKFRRWLVSATPWVASGTYVANNVYEYESILYKCIKDHTGVATTPDLDTTNWIKWLDKTQNWSWTSDKTQFNIGYITTDNLIMSDLIDVYTFGDYYNRVNNVEIGRINLDYMINNFNYSSKLNNIVFYTSDNLYACSSNVFGDNCFNNTVGDEFINNTVGTFFCHNTVENGFSNNTVGDDFNTNTVERGFYYNTVGDGFSNNTVGDGFSTNTVGDDFSYNNVGNYFQLNTVVNGFIINTVGTFFGHNTVENGFNNNTVGNYFTNNTVGDGFSTNTVGDDFRHNYLKYSPTSTNFTTATHVYGDYNCEIFKSSTGNLRLKYSTDTNDVITDITA